LSSGLSVAQVLTPLPTFCPHGALPCRSLDDDPRTLARRERARVDVGMGKGGCCHIHRIGSGCWTVVDRECPLNLSERPGGPRRDECLDDGRPGARGCGSGKRLRARLPGRRGRSAVAAWGNTVMSIHLAAAGLSRYLPWPVPAAEHVDCVTALHAAQRELLSLDAECGLALIVLTQVRARLATALTQAHSLPR
jgi:hypothetical protein